MPVYRALAEWLRVLRPGGRVGFSGMRADEPPAAALFRRMALARGVRLADPSARLGTEDACADVLGAAGFDRIRVGAGTVHFTAGDLGGAWQANERGCRAQLRSALDAGVLREFERDYRAAVGALRGSLASAEVLYATATKPTIGSTAPT